MPGLKHIQALVLHAFQVLGLLSSKLSRCSNPSSLDSDNTYPVVTDLTICSCSQNESLHTCSLDSTRWQRVEKDLYLHATPGSAWLHVAQAQERDLTADDRIIVDVKLDHHHHDSSPSDVPWDSRPGGIWVLRNKYADAGDQAVTDVDVLFGSDAVDPRPQWALMRQPLRLNASSEIPVARLSIQHGKLKLPIVPRPVLRIREDGKFKILQVSDTHMVTGRGVCKDAVDVHGQPLPETEADPLTVNFISRVLDAEKPDLVILTGDQVHHDVPDTQSALFKVVAPLIEREIPYAAVFGNHDDEGLYALPRTAQMSLLCDLPFSLSQLGPEHIDGVGNYYLQILDSTPSPTALATIFLLDSHGQIPSEVKNPDYAPITQTQIDWFTNTSQTLRKARENDSVQDRVHLSLAFMHIPLPEFAGGDLIIKGGRRREPAEGPSCNSHFYDALAQEGIAAVGCGHDHVNDFCALLPQQIPTGHGNNGTETHRSRPWLCYGGGSGFGGYCSYGSKRYHRRMRIWEIDMRLGSLTTWKRVEYASERIDELVLIETGEGMTSSEVLGEGTGDSTDQAVLS